MRRFVFRLEGVLRHRETVERLREQAFTHAQGEHATALLRVEELQSHYRETVARRPSAEIGVRFDAPSIQSRERYLEALQLQILQAEERAEVARLIAEEKRAAMVTARQAREAVSRLRDKDLAEHSAEMQRRSQETLDEVAAVQFSRLHAESRLRQPGGTHSALSADGPGPEGTADMGRKAA